MKTLLRTIGIVAAVLVLYAGACAVRREIRNRGNTRIVSDAQVTTISLTIDGTERRALVHVPSGADATATLPLVLMLHGAGGTAEMALVETAFVARSDAHQFIVAFPEATRPDAGKPAAFGSNDPTWNDGSGRFHSGQRNVADVEFIARLLDEIESRYSVDRSRIFVAGFSNGASMAFRIGIELSDRIAAVAPVAGALWIREPKCARPVSLLYITGTADSLNPMEGGVPNPARSFRFERVSDTAKPPVIEHITKWSNMLGCMSAPVTLTNTPAGVTTTVYEGCRGESRVVFTTIAGHGHTWPGGTNALPSFIVGDDTSPVSATDEIWKFFAAHARDTHPK
ncbi:MAG: PHB depolymerase family esterase [Planctomycetota bacterium]|nr:PHB depolymerase family esterase [Planctomycetota bacterium]